MLLRSANNPFSAYYAEVLRTEGLNSFAAQDIATVTVGVLDQYSVVIVGDYALTSQQVTLLSDWVNAGGNLIAMRPDKQLASLAGVTDQTSTQGDAYLLVDTTQAPGHGIVAQTIQYHGTADLYAADVGTQTVATLYSSATTATLYPAVTLRDVGTNGGKVCVFTFDMARSLVYSHQGNPAWAGQERDGQTPIRPDDLFYGAKTGDVQPDYVDMTKVAIPQADELQRLLTNVIQHMHASRNPIPKFWYFPKGKKAVIVMTGDDHATSNGTQTLFDYMLAQSPPGSTVENWDALRATSWMYTSTPFSDAQAASYLAQGFDMGVHVSTGANDYASRQALDNIFSSDIAGFRAVFPSLPPQTGNRTHAAVWSDWFSTPTVEFNHGIRMDLGYYYWPNAFVQNRPGFFTGSGLSMRYADTDGTMIDVYQTPSHLVNESGMQFPAAIHTQVQRALGPEGYYGALGTHYDYTDNFGQQLVDVALQYDIPAVSAQQMLDWNDGRNASYFDTAQWTDNVLQFTATVDTKVGTMLTGMLPIRSVQGVLSAMTLDGDNLSFEIEAIKGVQYAIFTVGQGVYAATYDPDTTAPTILAVTPADTTTGINPLLSDISVEFDEQIDIATVTSSTIELKDAGDNVVTCTLTVVEKDTGSSVSIEPVSPLNENTAYTVTVHGGSAPCVQDVVGNALEVDYTWGFTTGQAQLSLWYPTAQVVDTATADTAQVELGTTFASDQDGTITDISFYKSFNDASSHTVNLWNAAGTIIGTGTTSSETASGWQTATLTTPVAITANTTYVASYVAPVGRYSLTAHALASGFSNGPLHVPINGGVYSYSGNKPNQSFNGSNYYVDVIFKQP